TGARRFGGAAAITDRKPFTVSTKVMEKIKLDPETSALILIDLQHGIVARKTSPHPASSVVTKAASLAATFRKHSSPLIYVRVDLANMLQVHADQLYGTPFSFSTEQRCGGGR